MSKKLKGQKIKYIETPLTSFQRINRWNICQAITKYLYRSEMLDTEIEELLSWIVAEKNKGNQKYEK